MVISPRPVPSLIAPVRPVHRHFGKGNIHSVQSSVFYFFIFSRRYNRTKVASALLHWISNLPIRVWKPYYYYYYYYAVSLIIIMSRDGGDSSLPERNAGYVCSPTSSAIRLSLWDNIYYTRIRIIILKIYTVVLYHRKHIRKTVFFFFNLFKPTFRFSLLSFRYTVCYYYDGAAMNILFIYYLLRLSIL